MISTISFPSIIDPTIFYPYLIRFCFNSILVQTIQIEIGFSEHLKNQTAWRNLHGEILAESDAGKQAELRKQSVLANYFVSSASAVSEEGSIVSIIDNNSNKNERILI